MEYQFKIEYRTIHGEWRVYDWEDSDISLPEAQRRMAKARKSGSDKNFRIMRREIGEWEEVK